MQDFDTFCKSYDVLFFLSNEGMLVATAIAAECAQNSPKLPNFVKICPKSTSLRNFEILPKIKILIYFFKQKILYVEDAPKHVLTVWIFNTPIFSMPFLLSKNDLCM
jgi:hypothetical protein